MKKLLFKILPKSIIQNFDNLFEYLGIHSSEKIESWLDAKLKNLLSIQHRPILFKDLIIPTIVTATNLENSNSRNLGEQNRHQIIRCQKQ